MAPGESTPTADPASVVRRLVGLVGPTGAAGGSAGGDAWNLIVHLVAWRDADARDPSLQKGRLRCLLPMPRAEISAWMGRVRPYGIVELLVADGMPEAGLVTGGRIQGVDLADTALRQYAEELQGPVMLDHPVFGRLVYDRRFDWYDANTRWRGAPVALSLETGTPAADAPAVQATLAHAAALFADQADWGARIDAYAVEKLLPLKNGNWRDDSDDGGEEPPIEAAEFVARMTLESITIDPAGGFVFLYDDGDLFWGHAIQVSGTLADGPTDADIPG